jgi:hypothetical protein
MTPDPFQASGGPRDPASWNRYAYTRADPINNYDPAGLVDCPAGMACFSVTGTGYKDGTTGGGSGAGSNDMLVINDNNSGRDGSAEGGSDLSADYVVATGPLNAGRLGAAMRNVIQALKHPDCSGIFWKCSAWNQPA